MLSFHFIKRHLNWELNTKEKKSQRRASTIPWKFSLLVLLNALSIECTWTKTRKRDYFFDIITNPNSQGPKKQTNRSFFGLIAPRGFDEADSFQSKPRTTKASNLVFSIALSGFFKKNFYRLRGRWALLCISKWNTHPVIGTQGLKRTRSDRHGTKSFRTPENKSMETSPVFLR